MPCDLAGIAKGFVAKGRGARALGYTGQGAAENNGAPAAFRSALLSVLPERFAKTLAVPTGLSGKGEASA